MKKFFIFTCAALLISSCFSQEETEIENDEPADTLPEPISNSNNAPAAKGKSDYQKTQKVLN
jgi:hypothetical protein